MNISKSIENQYYICKDNGNVAWNLNDSSISKFYFIEYFEKVLKVLDQKLEISNYIFYITWNVQELPSYGDNVIAIVLGDEQSRVPAYFNKIHALFKCYGVYPYLGISPIFNPSFSNILNLIQYARNLKVNAFNIFRYKIYKTHLKVKHNIQPSIFEIPLGYYNQLDLPIKKFSHRTFDVFFAGSVVHEEYSRMSWRNYLGTPKSLSRNHMLLKLNDFKEAHPEFHIELSLTSSFQATKSTDAELYSERMMNTKICLVPRGASYETFRLFEAMRYGCIVIAEFLPPYWFYIGSPIIQLRSWNELPTVLDHLLNDRHAMDEKHQQTLSFWHSKCSEKAIGNFMFHKIVSP